MRGDDASVLERYVQARPGDGEVGERERDLSGAVHAGMWQGLCPLGGENVRVAGEIVRPRGTA